MSADSELEATIDAFRWEHEVHAIREALPPGVLHAADDPQLLEEARTIVRLVDELLPKVAARIQAIYDGCDQDDWERAGDVVDATVAREADTALMVIGARLVDQLGGLYGGPVTWAELVASAQAAQR